jgi:hypothetical protein
MKPANWANLAAEGSGLGEANVTRLARRPAADDAGLPGDKFAMLLVAQANGLGGHAARPRLPWQYDRSWS